MSKELPEKSPIYCFDCGKRLLYESKRYSLTSINFLYSCKDVHSEVQINKKNDIVAYYFYWINNNIKCNIISDSNYNTTIIKSKIDGKWKIMLNVDFYIPIELDHNKLKVDNAINTANKLLKVRAFT